MTIFKSMTPDPRPFEWWPRDPGPPINCERCGGAYFTGDWPWCKGNQADHHRR